MITKETAIADLTGHIEDLRDLIRQIEITQSYVHSETRSIGKVTGEYNNQELYKLNHTLTHLTKALHTLLDR